MQTHSSARCLFNLNGLFWSKKGAVEYLAYDLNMLLGLDGDLS
jgi:hypothetical protein